MGAHLSNLSLLTHCWRKSFMVKGSFSRWSRSCIFTVVASSASESTLEATERIASLSEGYWAISTSDRRPRALRRGQGHTRNGRM